MRHILTARWLYLAAKMHERPAKQRDLTAIQREKTAKQDVAIYCYDNDCKKPR